MTATSPTGRRQRALPADPDDTFGHTGAVDRTHAVRRVGGAAGLVLGAAGFLTVNTMYAWVTTTDGGDDSTAANALALYGAHPVFTRVAIAVVMAATLLFVAGVLAAMRVLRERSPWLSLVGGTLMIAGYVCYLGINASTLEQLALAERGVTGPEVAAALDAGMGDPAGMWIFFLFVLGNLVGTPILAVAMIRSRIVPVWAGLGVMAWAPLHVVGLFAGTEWFAVAGAALQLTGLGALARVILRTAR